MTTEGARDVSVLVLEDDDGIRDALVDALTLEGFSVCGAATLREAFEIVARNETDACLVDLRLSCGEAGSDFIRPQADDARAPAMVMLSASEELAVPLMSEFNLQWIRKPFDLDAVVAAIREAVHAGERPRRSTPVAPDPNAGSRK